MRMQRNRGLLWTVFCILQIVICVHANGYYSIVAPGTIRSNFKYNVAVSLHKADAASQIKVGITGPSYNESKTIEVQPMSTQNVVFDVPKIKDGNYNLTASGLNGLTFENTTKLNYGDYKPHIFIQTDKATYKPGDLVQFRVLFLDENTRPAVLKTPITIAVDDGARNRIKQFKDVQLTKGVYTGKFQLSEQPVLGSWNIEVSNEETGSESKNFDVDKYVLPKFEVTIHTAKDVAIADKAIKATVRAKYTYGKSVKGKAILTLSPSYYSYYGSNTDSGNLLEKTVNIDGKAHVEFDLSNYLQDRSYSPPLKLFAIVEEELTGNKQNASTVVNMHSERFRIQSIDAPHVFHLGQAITIKVAVKNLDETPVFDSKNAVKLLVEPPKSYFSRALSDTPTPKDEEKTREFSAFLNENGIATFEFTLGNTSSSYYSLSAIYLDQRAHLSSISRAVKNEENASSGTTEPLQLKLRTDKPRLGNDIIVEVLSNQEIPYLIYTLTARGKILKSEHVPISDGSKTYKIKFTPTFEMVPHVKVYAHFVFDNNLRFDELNIDLEKNFENKIEITAPVQAKPGEDVKLQVHTDPDSFVGLLGVDQSVLLLKSGNDLDKERILNSLDDFDTNTPYIRGYGRYPGQSSGLVTLTNANYPYNEELIMPTNFDDRTIYYAMALPRSDVNGAFVRKFFPESSIRRFFLESWIFIDKNSDENGFTLEKKIPDTITSWIVTGFSLNSKTGIALTEDATKIRVFQPFFVSTNLPYSVKRGEVISIPVIIFNYLDKALDAEVTMDNTDGEYEFTEATNEVDEKTIDTIKRTKRVSIPSNTGKSVSFMIRPKKVGVITLKVTAVTPLAGDAIHQTLKVEAEGKTVYENRAIFLNLNEEKPKHSETLELQISAEAVPDSEFIEFSVVGDLLGPTIQNLDKLVRMPYGCGEQNMVNFVPNILVLKYLQAINQQKPTIVERAKKFLEIGYQRELTYKHDDGSYSAFGKSDKSGSTWLTAYVARSFHQAMNFTDIDTNVIQQALDFLASTQAANGSFVEGGKLFDFSHQNELGLTSFVLLAFLENHEHISKHEQTIDKALQFVIENAEKSDDLYALSIAATALQLSKSPLAEKILAKLQPQAQQADNLKWWSKSETAHSNDVEITAYILQALLEQEPAEKVLPIIRWLISQRNSNGGFKYTQDTVVGLQALIKFAEKVGSGKGDISIDFTSTGGAENKGSIQVNPENALVLQTHVLPKQARQVDFTAKGKGSALVQLSYRYNLAEKDKQPSFKLSSNINDKSTAQQLMLDVCAEFVPLEADAATKESNMAVLEVALPSGYTAETESFDKIARVERVKRTETKNSDSTVIIYFDSLSAADVKCVPIEATRTHAVAKQKPAAISIYDYYDNGRRATEYYEVKSSLCDICDGEDCGAECQKTNATR